MADKISRSDFEPFASRCHNFICHALRHQNQRVDYTIRLSCQRVGVPAAVGNDPRAMYMKRNEQLTGAYNVYINCNYLAEVNKSEVKDAGIKILQEVLRVSAIKPVNLWCGTLAIDDSRRNIYGTAMQVMDAGKAFNVARVSYALTEAGFLRVFGFACRERTDGFWEPSNQWGMGRTLAKHSFNRTCHSQLFG